MKYISLIFTLLVITINASAEEVLSSNERHNCAIKDDGTIVCWGQKTKTAPNDTNFARISAGKSHNCALKEDGTMVCWGLSSKPSTAQEGKFTQISAAETHNCAIKFDETVICWGNDIRNTGKIDPPSGNFLQVSAGYEHSCGVTTDNTILCWGEGRNGETTVPSGTYSQVSAGDEFTCAIKTDDTLACWGKNNEDQTSPPDGQFSNLSVGEDHACAIRTSDNSITCWGKNNDDKATSPSGTFKEVSVGSDHSCAKKTDNTVECWGSNSFGISEPPEGLILIDPIIDLPPPVCTLTTNVIGKGIIVRSPDEPYYCGTEVTLRAIPDEGYIFDYWVIDGIESGSDNPITITMDKDKTVTAVFEEEPIGPKLIIDQFPIKGGSISANKNTLTNKETIFPINQEVNLEAKPERCYSFSGWGIDCSIYDTNPICKLKMDSDKTISPNFVEAKFSLELIAEHGKIIPTPPKDSYDCDEEVLLTAIPDKNYDFVGWKVDGKNRGSDETLNVTMDHNIEVIAIFEPGPYCELTHNIIGEGSISGLPSTKLCYQERILKAIPATCRKFKQWHGACSGKMTTCEITLDDKKSVIAEFEPETFTLTTNARNCQITSNPNNEIYDCGSTVRLTAVPNQGFEFFEWREDGKVIGSDPNITITMNEDKNIIAECIGPEIGISPQISQIYTEEKVELTVVNGVAPYTWSTTGGQLTAPTGQKVHFSANVPGTYNITVTDNTGASAQATVEVSQQFSLSPQYVSDLQINEIQPFSITGGKPPYLLTTTLGVSQSINPDANGIATYNFTAPDNPGEVKLIVTDAIGGEQKALINIIDPKIIITPSGTVVNPLILSLGESISFTVKGGVPNYNWTVTAGTLSSPQGKTVTYIAPKVSGKQTITVTDNKGNKAEAHVKVVNELACSPHLTTMILGDKIPITFRAMGGAEDYRWQVEAGTINPPEGAEVNYQPPEDQEGEFTVTCKDAQDTSVNPLVRVVKGLNVSPTEKILAIGESIQLTVTGGQAPYTWVAECGDLTPTTGTLVGYTAPRRNGICEVTVTDALSQVAKVRIEVRGNLIVTPIKTVVAIGETVKISANRGTEPYTWSDGQTERTWTGKFNTVGRHEVTVTDGTGDIGLAIVDVIHNNLGLTPERPFLSRNEILNISVTGGTSPYVWNAEAGTLSSVQGTRVAYIAPDQPGSYNITVRDGRDVQGQVKVIVKADVVDLSGNIRNDMGSISSNIIVDGVERHEKEILVDAASNIEASFSLEMPNDGQQYNIYGALLWVGLEEQPVLFFKKSDQQTLVRYDAQPLDSIIYKTAAAGETVVIKDIYNGPLSNYSGHQMMFYIGYAAVGTNVLDSFLFNAKQPYNVLVK
jgi:hypothetical protein